MDTLKLLTDELTQEYNTTKKFLDNYPDGKNDYAPHSKSMKMNDLATHIVDVFAWPKIILESTHMDFADGYKPEKGEDTGALKKILDKQYNNGVEALKKADDEDLILNWSIQMNGEKIMEWTKYGAIRHSLDQITHHRAQLGVYYRLQDIPVPGSYGPSADFPNG